MNGISMLVLSVGGIIAVLFFVTYAAQRHDLNGIKDKTVGNGQHGTARWATRQEVKQTYHHVPYTPNYGGRPQKRENSPQPMESRCLRASFWAARAAEKQRRWWIRMTSMC